jgi:hypothetical protein
MTRPKQDPGVVWPDFGPIRNEVIHRRMSPLQLVFPSRDGNPKIRIISPRCIGMRKWICGPLANDGLDGLDGLDGKLENGSACTQAPRLPRRRLLSTTETCNLYYRTCGCWRCRFSPTPGLSRTKAKRRISSANRPTGRLRTERRRLDQAPGRSRSHPTVLVLGRGDKTRGEGAPPKCLLLLPYMLPSCQPSCPSSPPSSHHLLPICHSLRRSFVYKKGLGGCTLHVSIPVTVARPSQSFHPNLQHPSRTCSETPGASPPSIPQQIPKPHGADRFAT